MVRARNERHSLLLFVKEVVLIEKLGLKKMATENWKYVSIGEKRK